MSKFSKWWDDAFGFSFGDFLSVAMPFAAPAIAARETTQAIKKAGLQQEAEMKRLKKEEEKNKLQTMMRMQRRRGATGEQKMRSDILTSPLGVIGQPQTAQKTLLGQ